MSNLWDSRRPDAPKAIMPRAARQRSDALRIRLWRRGTGAFGIGALMIAAILLPMTGCRDEFDPQQYGEVIHEVPSIHKDGGRYPLPQLEDPDDDPSKTGE
jgi:hypothetical protein